MGLTSWSSGSLSLRKHEAIPICARVLEKRDVFPACSFGQAGTRIAVIDSSLMSATTVVQSVDTQLIFHQRPSRPAFRGLGRKGDSTEIEVLREPHRLYFFFESVLTWSPFGHITSYCDTTIEGRSLWVNSLSASWRMVVSFQLPQIATLRVKWVKSHQ